MSLKLAPLLVLAALPLAESAVARQAASLAPPTVSVVGVATEDDPPDTAFLSLQIADPRPTASEAEGENARVSAAVIEGLKAEGVEAKDIATVGLALSPVWSEEQSARTGQTAKRTLIGYQAFNTLSVRVRDIAKTGLLIARAVQNGATYQSVAFDLSDRETRDDALRTKSVANAMHRAALYAEGGGMKLGALQTINAAGGSSPGIVTGWGGAHLAGVARPASMPMSVEAGLVTLSASVTAVWTLAPK